MVRHLLEMSSGIGDFFGEKFDQTPKDNSGPITIFCDVLTAYRWLFSRGPSGCTPTVGYIVLGAIIEKVSDSHTTTNVRQNIYLPTEMKNTDCTRRMDPVENLAEGYSHPNDSSDLHVNKHLHSSSSGKRGRGRVSTVEDLLKFTISLHNNQLLSPEYTDWFFSGIATRGFIAVRPGPQIPRSVVLRWRPGINADIEADFDAGQYA